MKLLVLVHCAQRLYSIIKVRQRGELNRACRVASPSFLKSQFPPSAPHLTTAVVFNTRVCKPKSEKPTFFPCLPCPQKLPDQPKQKRKSKLLFGNEYLNLLYFFLYRAAGGAMTAPPDLGRSVNPILTRRGRLFPLHY